MMLVTVEQAQEHLRIDSDADADDLRLKIEAASAAVMDYLGGYTATFTDSHGNIFHDSSGLPIVPERVQQGVLMTVGWLYRERDGSNEYGVQAGHGFTLPQGATAILYSLRRPVLA